VRSDISRSGHYSVWMKTALVVAALLPAAVQSGLAQATYCPASIAVDQKIETAPDGWKVAQDEITSMLSGITFFSGPPEEKAGLVYDRWTKRNGLAHAIWRFRPESPHRIWLTCRYSSTRVVLAKELPADTSECVVTYDLKASIAGEPVVLKIDCHSSPTRTTRDKTVPQSH
jgi:hypothetical protein